MIRLDVYSQTDLSVLYGIVMDDSSSIQILFSYPDSIRHKVLTASTYPQGIARISDVQKNSSTTLRNITSGYNRNKQTQLWDIAR